MDKHEILMGMIIALILIPFFNGCESPPGTYTSRSFTDTETEKLASTNYGEKWIINTEPPECRVYVQDDFVGVSPVELTVNGGKAVYARSGQYTYVHDIKWDTDVWLWGTDSVPRERWGQKMRTSSTGWSSAKWSPERGGYWTVKTFKEGYETNSTTVTCGDSVFAKAFKEIGRYDTPDEVVGTRHLLLELRPLSMVSRTEEAYRSGSKLQDEQRRRMYEEAKAEYEAALEAYNTALKEYNDAKILANAPKAYPHPVLGILMSVAEPYNIAEKERALEIARQRLERAKAKMNHAEW